MQAKRRRRLRNWLPWHAFDGLGIDWRARGDNVRGMSPQDVRRNALILLVIALVIATAAMAYAVPRFSLLIDLGGGLIVATVVLYLTGQWQELRRGLIETGHWPTADVQLEMIRQYVLDTLVQAQNRRCRCRLPERSPREETPQ